MIQSKEEAKKILRDEVEILQGCKALQLISREAILPLLGDYNILALLDELIDEGELVEIEYILPEFDYKLKSFLLPKGTNVHIINNQKENLTGQ